MASSVIASEPGRWVVLGLVVLLAAGCCRVDPALQGPAEVTVWAIHDGFHSSLIVPAGIDPPAAAGPAEAPYLEIGFSDVGWTVEGDESTRHAIRLGLWPDTGAVEIGAIHRPDVVLVDPSVVAHRTLALSRSGWDGLSERLGWWLASGEPHGVVDGRIYLPSTQRFSAYNSCNDFVADLLKAGGLPICARPWRTAGGLFRQIDRAEAQRRAWVDANGANGTVLAEPK